MLYGTKMSYETENVVWDNLSSSFYGEYIELISKICVC